LSAACLAEGEIEREGRRVLRKLTISGAQLVGRGEDYGLILPGGRGAKQLSSIPAALVEAFLRRGWLVSAPGAARGFALSDAGLGWIRRALAGDDPFGAQHRLEARRDVVDPNGHTRSVIVNDGESPLGWLFRRRGSDRRLLISETQFKAGERLRADFTIAQLSPRLGVDLTARWSPDGAALKRSWRCPRRCWRRSSDSRMRFAPPVRGFRIFSSMCAAI
jgi:hypothetical protein